MARIEQSGIVLGPRRQGRGHRRGGSTDEPFRHVISLGCRCSQASIFKALGDRRYACPFDWIFSSAAIVAQCLQDDFQAFLDRKQYVLNGTVFDAIGLKPGSAPRERKLIGHKMFSEMTKGVGRGTIFNHRDPLHDEEDFQYTQRCVERFRRVLACTDQKLFVILNLNHQLWVEKDIRTVFEELCQRTGNFLLLAIDCSWKNQGAEALQDSPAELVSESHEGRRLVMYRLPCVGDNTGSYFREDVDAQRVRSLLIEPFRFDLAPDPLQQAAAEAPQQSGGYPTGTAPPAAALEEVSATCQEPRSRWGRVSVPGGEAVSASRRWGSRRAPVD